MQNHVKTVGDQVSHLAHEAVVGAEHAIHSTQQLAQHGLDSLSGLRSEGDSALQRLAADTNALGHRGMDALREGGQQLREKSLHARQSTTDYIQHDPIKSMLMAASVGAALMGLLALFSRHRDSGR